jgi:spoIIIJ-associated protein
LLACDDGILKTLEMMRVETLESGASTSHFVDRPGPAYKHDQETDMTEQDTSPVEQDSSSVDEGSQQDLTAQDVTKGVPAEEKGDVESTPTTPTSLLEREGEVAADFLEQLLDIADLDGDIDVDVDGDRAAVAIVDSEEGRVSRRLVGSDGKVLEALQELTRLAVQAATGERSRLMLDVAGYRAERRAAVVTIAQAAIAIVKSTDEKVAMDPMTAFERKVVHDEVLAAGLLSESEGVEPQRHVVILPA